MGMPAEKIAHCKHFYPPVLASSIPITPAPPSYFELRNFLPLWGT